MGSLPGYDPARPSTGGDRLSWFQTEVAGRRGVFGVGGGDGPPVVFLHGWALGSRAYKRALSRLMTRGCRVYAPALPAFGGTPGLHGAETTLAGYAGWVARFMDSVGIEEPAMVIGHSFGGGVAIKLAAEHPERVSYLVLLDAVGGVAPRPPWDWAASFVRELWPPASAAGMAVAIAQDLVPNLVGNPVGLLRIGSLARTADLRNEAEQLRARGLPVLVLTGQADSVIPKEAFETLCDTIGTDGRIVVGGHSWMLADPDSFAVEVAPVVDRIVATHREDRATSRSGELDRLLGAMKLPRGLRRDLVEGAPPLWLLSDTTAVLAADLALAHPGLQPNEVRAVARPIAGSADIRLTVVANDRTGLLADSAAVLSSGGLSILGASAATWPDRRLALHSFVIEDGQRVANEEWDEIGRRLRVATMRPLRPVRTAPPERVTLHGGDRDQMLVTVTVRDEMGALSNLCRKFSDHGVNIESLHARSVDGRAVDTFLVSGVTDAVAVKEMFTPRGWRLRAV